MKERPILFSTPMVQAILAGHKTQTRRMVKFKKLWNGFGEVSPNECRPDGCHNQQYLHVHYNGNGESDLVTSHRHFCPYGEIGDRLWVKETFRMQISGIEYRADEPPRSTGKWKPSLFMPRDLSRITIEITGIRVERLNEIKYNDCKAEGLNEPRAFAQYGLERQERDELFRISYKNLWESINGKGSWDQNPWVWVIEFKTVSR